MVVFTWMVSQQLKLLGTYHSTQIIAIFGQARRQELLDVDLDATDAGECPQEVPWDLSCSKTVEQAPWTQKATIKSSTLGLVVQLTTDDNERCDVVNIANR